MSDNQAGNLAVTLRSYFQPTTEDGDYEFQKLVDVYHRAPNSIDLIGLIPQLEYSIQNILEATREINSAFETELPPADVKEILTELYNRLEDIDEDKEKAKWDADARMDYYAGRQFRIPFTKYSAPLWLIALISLISGLTFYALHQYLDYFIIGDVLSALMVISTAIFAFAVVSMMLLREDVVKDDKRRAKQREQAFNREVKEQRKAIRAEAKKRIF